MPDDAQFSLRLSLRPALAGPSPQGSRLVGMPDEEECTAVAAILQAAPLPSPFVPNEDDDHAGRMEMSSNEKAAEPTASETFRFAWAGPLAPQHLLEADATKDLAITISAEALALAEAETLLLVEDMLLIPADNAQEEHIADDDSKWDDERMAFARRAGVVAQEVAEAETLRLGDGKGEDERIADVAEVEERITDGAKKASRWRKEDYGEARAAHMMISTNSNASWQRSDERQMCINQMPVHELKRRRFRMMEDYI
jgi:hypothetical protein